ncbi:uncharacterized protein LOC133153215 [Syngnathus typhle]|uniref:uncharacterized protein LOC133153215 n=1 Tax=Syngnathus typhle TaxID=161592 RepID=UPI002A6AF0A1|nr:uncharacterized protein LOC133153215 [Syngnathus typhle]
MLWIVALCLSLHLWPTSVQPSANDPRLISTTASMLLKYSALQLLKLNNHTTIPPDITATIKTHGQFRRPRYIHRSSRRKFIYSRTEQHCIPSLWSRNRSTPSDVTRHHNNKPHVRSAYLQLLTKAPPPIQLHPSLKFALLNTRSLNKKGPILSEFITDNIDFFSITETWQKPLEYIHLNRATPPGYTYMDKPRDGRGGGIATIYRQHLKPTAVTITTPSSFEHQSFKLPGPKPLVTAIIYRPPKPNPAFLSDLSEFLTQLCAISPSVILLGDFNIHVDSTTCKTATEFLDILNSFNITQHVDFPTHKKGHTLDLICTTGLSISNLTSFNLTDILSDHLALTLDIDIPTPLIKQQCSISYRNMKSIHPPLSFRPTD